MQPNLLSYGVIYVDIKCVTLGWDIPMDRLTYKVTKGL